SSRGQVYKSKVWRLPIAPPNGRGKSLKNFLPLAEDERITTVMALPEDEAAWETLDVMFATESGNVRRNKLSDFVQVNRNGKIAMKLDEGDQIVDVATCSEMDNVLLTTALGQCIRFSVDEVRVFKGRDSTGVRGINLAAKDRVISLTILRHVDATAEERAAYLKMRRAMAGEAEEGAADAEEAVVAEAAISPERYAQMGAAEQFVLTISDNDRNGNLVASFPVEESDQIMLVSDGGQLIRCPVNGIRVAGRGTQGVIVMDAREGERVVSVERVSEGEGGDEDEGEEGGAPA
ncbi:MAG: DNA gyrase subunit A, partial [Beijerinckiaceae bacterium]|nr:DNA gyrase subunit A [Beijerinckiaceae bacterium]